MTITQRQHLLAYLGYYTGKVDGAWGSMSRTACRFFQQDMNIKPDGCGDPDTDKALRNAVAKDLLKPEPVTDKNVGSKTGTFWDEIEFFDREEFRCQCGGKYCNGFPVEPQEKMVRTVNEIRRRLGVPVQIVTAGGSGVRCRQHNASPQVKGAANSLHLTGNAADLHSDKSPQEMYRVAQEVLGNTGELGLYSWGIHVGIGKYSRFNG
jgi:peptidoglycan hydrolase-like protein with peptidoglycan-binding domain